MSHARERERVPSQGQQSRPRGAVGTVYHGVLALQRSVGNTAVGQVVAREAAATGTVQISKLKVSVTGGNLAAWTAGDVPDSLDVTSQQGSHSAALKRLAEDRTKIDALSVTVATPNKGGQVLDLGSLVIEITNGRVRSYDVDGTTESWRIADFDGVHRTRTTHKVS
jgi:hypothetical protein